MARTMKDVYETAMELKKNGLSKHSKGNIKRGIKSFERQLISGIKTLKKG